MPGCAGPLACGRRAARRQRLHLHRGRQTHPPARLADRLRRRGRRRRSLAPDPAAGQPGPPVATRRRAPTRVTRRPPTAGTPRRAPAQSSSLPTRLGGKAGFKPGKVKLKLEEVADLGNVEPGLHHGRRHRRRPAVRGRAGGPDPRHDRAGQDARAPCSICAAASARMASEACMRSRSTPTSTRTASSTSTTTRRPGNTRVDRVQAEASPARRSMPAPDGRSSTSPARVEPQRWLARLWARWLPVHRARATAAATRPATRSATARTRTTCSATSCASTWTRAARTPSPRTTRLPRAAAARRLWSYGLRNPWRASFDTKTGNLWIGDVGQDQIEEVDIQPKGKGGLNFGWSVMEGSKCHKSAELLDQGADAAGRRVSPRRQGMLGRRRLRLSGHRRSRCSMAPTCSPTTAARPSMPSTRARPRPARSSHPSGCCARPTLSSCRWARATMASCTSCPSVAASITSLPSRSKRCQDRPQRGPAVASVRAVTRMSSIVERYDRDAEGYERYWAPVLDASARGLLDRVLAASQRSCVERPHDRGCGYRVRGAGPRGATPLAGARVTGVDPSVGMLADGGRRRAAAGVAPGRRSG